MQLALTLLLLLLLLLALALLLVALLLAILLLVALLLAALLLAALLLLALLAVLVLRGLLLVALLALLLTALLLSLLVRVALLLFLSHGVVVPCRIHLPQGAEVLQRTVCTPTLRSRPSMRACVAKWRRPFESRDTCPLARVRTSVLLIHSKHTQPP